MTIINPLCEICGQDAVIVWIYLSDGVEIDRCPLCENHK